MLSNAYYSLFLKLRLVKDLSEIAVLKAIGFSVKDIRCQYMIKIGLTSVIAIISGILATNILGDKIVNIALGIMGLGVKKVELITNSTMEYIIIPLLLMSLILLVTRIVLRAIKSYNIISIINE